jgi:glycosyltransferase involved in cell wall biosynthesis
MKLAILGTRGIPARYGGFETFAEEIAKRLVECGVSVTVFCQATSNAQPKEYCDVYLEYVPALRLGPLTTIAYDLRCLWRARKGYDVVYMLGYGASLFCFIPRIFGAKVWINMDGIEWKRSKWSTTARVWLKTMEAVAMWTPNRIIADAAAIERNLAARYRRKPDCAVIPYGATVIDSAPSVDMLAEWNLTRDGYYLVVCRLEPENHVLEIVRGYIASDSSRPLVIVGDHNNNSSYVATLLAAGSARVFFVGTVYDREKLASLRYYCRAYIHGHSVGGTNPSMLEALASGNTIFAHDNPYNREVSGESARYFFDEGDVSALITEAENRELTNESTRNRAREIITTRYTWEQVTREYLKLLSDPK